MLNSNELPDNIKTCVVFFETTEVQNYFCNHELLKQLPLIFIGIADIQSELNRIDYEAFDLVFHISRELSIGLALHNAATAIYDTLTMTISVVVAGQCDPVEKGVFLVRRSTADNGIEAACRLVFAFAAPLLQPIPSIEWTAVKNAFGAATHVAYVCAQGAGEDGVNRACGPVNLQLLRQQCLSSIKALYVSIVHGPDFTAELSEQITATVLRDVPSNVDCYVAMTNGDLQHSAFELHVFIFCMR